MPHISAFFEVLHTAKRKTLKTICSYSFIVFRLSVSVYHHTSYISHQISYLVLCCTHMTVFYVFLFPGCVLEELMVWLQDFIGELVLQENPAGTTSKTQSTTWEKGFHCSSSNICDFCDFCVGAKKAERHCCHSDGIVSVIGKLYCYSCTHNIFV